MSSVTPSLTVTSAEEMATGTGSGTDVVPDNEQVADETGFDTLHNHMDEAIGRAVALSSSFDRKTTSPKVAAFRFVDILHFIFQGVPGLPMCIVAGCPRNASARCQLDTGMWVLIP